MIEDKGLDEEVADKIGELVQQKGGPELLKTLQDNPALLGNEDAKKGLDDMALLFDYLSAYNAIDRISFDMSLARGLDYYTGVIYEVVTEGSAPGSATAQKQQKKAKKEHGKDFDEDRSADPSIGVGSVAAGGRYDNLVGMFSGKTQIPCVGISFGVDRIISITKSRLEAQKGADVLRSSEVDVYVMAFGHAGFPGMLKERMQISSTLWDAGIKAQYSFQVKPRLDRQFKAAEKIGVPFAVILGEEELAAGQVKIKEMGLPADHAEKDGVLIDKSSLVDEVRKRLKEKSLSSGIDAMSV